MQQNRIDFLYKFITAPTKIGSITPSSSFLTKKMFQDFDWEHISTIIELGAGTGVFTEYINEYKKVRCNVVVIEQDHKMRHNLESTYPDFYFGTKAEELSTLINNCKLDKADAIVSGLPFSIIPEEICNNIFENITNSLKDGGTFVAFQYSPYMLKKLKKYFSHIDMDFVLCNMPPAFVFKCKK